MSHPRQLQVPPVRQARRGHCALDACNFSSTVARQVTVQAQDRPLAQSTCGWSFKPKLESFLQKWTGSTKMRVRFCSMGKLSLPRLTAHSAGPRCLRHHHMRGHLVASMSRHIAPSIVIYLCFLDFRVYIYIGSGCSVRSGPACLSHRAWDPLSQARAASVLRLSVWQIGIILSVGIY